MDNPDQAAISDLFDDIWTAENKFHEENSRQIQLGYDTDGRRAGELQAIQRY